MNDNRVRYGCSFPGVVVKPALTPQPFQKLPDPVLTGAEADLRELLDAINDCPPPATEAGMRLAVVAAKLRERQNQRTKGPTP
jgi:hypothetical protein